MLNIVGPTMKTKPRNTKKSLPLMSLMNLMPRLMPAQLDEVRQEGYRLSFVAHPDDEAVGRRYGKQDERREKGVDSYILHNVSLSFIKMPHGRIL